MSEMSRTLTAHLPSTISQPWNKAVSHLSGGEHHLSALYTRDTQGDDIPRKYGVICIYAYKYVVQYLQWALILVPMQAYKHMGKMENILCMQLPATS